jgi:hypothetical protein
MTAPPGARMRWLTDVRGLLQAEGIAWTHFDYVGHFGVVDGPQGDRNVDPDARHGLGLTGANPPPPAAAGTAPQ